MYSIWHTGVSLCIRGLFKKCSWTIKSKTLKLSPVNKIHIFNVWVRYFVWNLKGYLWNSTQNILPIHWKIWFWYHCHIAGYLEGLVQDYNISIVNTLEILPSCAKPSVQWNWVASSSIREIPNHVNVKRMYCFSPSIFQHDRFGTLQSTIHILYKRSRNITPVTSILNICYVVNGSMTDNPAAYIRSCQ